METWAVTRSPMGTLNNKAQGRTIRFSATQSSFLDSSAPPCQLECDFRLGTLGVSWLRLPSGSQSVLNDITWVTCGLEWPCWEYYTTGKRQMLQGRASSLGTWCATSIFTHTTPSQGLLSREQGVITYFTLTFFL